MPRQGSRRRTPAPPKRPISEAERQARSERARLQHAEGRAHVVKRPWQMSRDELLEHTLSMVEQLGGRTDLLRAELDPELASKLGLRPGPDGESSAPVTLTSSVRSDDAPAEPAGRRVDSTDDRSAPAPDPDVHSAVNDEPSTRRVTTATPAARPARRPTLPPSPVVDRDLRLPDPARESSDFTLEAARAFRSHRPPEPSDAPWGTEPPGTHYL